MTWGEVARASGVGQPHTFTRLRVGSIGSSSGVGSIDYGSSSSSRARIMEHTNNLIHMNMMKKLWITSLVMRKR